MINRKHGVKMGKGAFVFAAILVMTLVTAVPAFANDHQDRRYSFVFSQGEQKTEYLRKEDNSPVYVTCKSASHPWIATIMGGKAEGDVGRFVEKQLTTGTTVFAKIEYDASWLYCVYGRPTYWDSAAWGYWSPDSV